MTKRTLKSAPVQVQVVHQAPDSATDADTETVKRKLAEHTLIDAAGSPVDDEEQADGISYKIVKDKDSGEAVDLPAFTWNYSKATEDERRMIALFGAKTLATNESSQARNNIKGGASAADQMDAVRERFALIGGSPARWVDRTREGVGAKIDKDALAQAAVEALTADGKTVNLAAIRAKLETDQAFVKVVRSNPAIAAAYAKLAGRPGKSLDDVMAAIA